MFSNILFSLSSWFANLLSFTTPDVIIESSFLLTPIIPNPNTFVPGSIPNIILS